MNDLLCSFAQKMQDSGVVVVIGVGMVFIILGMLIGIVSILRYLDKALDVWDEFMFYDRARRAEIKVIRQSNRAHFGRIKNGIKARLAGGEITKAVADEELATLKVDKIQAKADFAKSKNIINIKFDTVANIRHEFKYKIKHLLKDEKAAFIVAKSAISGEGKKVKIEELKSQRVITRAAQAQDIMALNAECKAKIALAREGKAVAANADYSDVNGSDAVTNDGELIAAITAAITMMMSGEMQDKKVGFRVRSIREIK